MPKWKPCKRRVFIKKLVKLGFNVPEPGGRHFHMGCGTKVLTIPSNDEYSIPQLKMMIKELEKLIGRTITLEECPDVIAFGKTLFECQKELFRFRPIHSEKTSFPGK